MDIDTVNITVTDDVAKIMESAEVDYKIKDTGPEKVVSVDNKDNVAAQQ